MLRIKTYWLLLNLQLVGFCFGLKELTLIELALFLLYHI